MLKENRRAEEIVKDMMNEAKEHVKTLCSDEKMILVFNLFVVSFSFYIAKIFSYNRIFTI
ncbi:MAG: hypothetical protein ACTHJ2_08020 [Candidatus Nitrosocosmicus sp.]